MSSPLRSTSSSSLSSSEDGYNDKISGKRHNSPSSNPHLKKVSAAAPLEDESDVIFFHHFDQLLILDSCKDRCSQPKNVWDRDVLDLPPTKKLADISSRRFTASDESEHALMDHFNFLSLYDVKHQKAIIESLSAPENVSIPLSLRSQLPLLDSLEKIFIEDATSQCCLEKLRDHPLLKKIELVVTRRQQAESGNTLENNMAILASCRKLEQFSFELRLEESIDLTHDDIPGHYLFPLNIFSNLTHLNLRFYNKPLFHYIALEDLPLVSFDIVFNAGSTFAERTTYHKTCDTSMGLENALFPYFALSNLPEKDANEYSILSFINTVRDIRFRNIIFTEIHYGGLDFTTLFSFGIGKYERVSFENCTMSRSNKESLAEQFDLRTINIDNMICPE